MSCVTVALAAILILHINPLRAHTEIENALLRLNAQIAATPGDADLYLQRGELYARHEAWVFAEANYLRAIELAPDHPRLDRLRGELELATGHPAEARAHFDAALAREPGDAESLILRARAHLALKVQNAAIADFNAALALIATPPPELFLERAARLAPADAIRSLDEGIERLGPAVTLNLRALALEESLGRIDDAVARLDRITEQSERKEAWLKRRGDLLARAGRASEARAAYASALAAIAGLPQWLRESPDMVRLATELARLTTSRS
jgi:tetratricopeptide (TPR) repeat protein